MIKFDRRALLRSASAAAFAVSVGGATEKTTRYLTKRSVINTNYVSTFDYQFINHFLAGDQFGPAGRTWTVGPLWNDGLDKSGWPASPVADNRPWGNGIRVPASSDFAGPYVLAWEGEGQIAFTAGTWTVNSQMSLRYKETSKGVWTGNNPRIVLNYTGPRLLIPVQVRRTGSSSHTNFCRNIKFFRLEDEEDLLKGKVFRRGYKQILVDLNPGVIRFMNWTGANSSHQCRFEHRTLPSYPSFNGYNWIASPAYGEALGTNQYALAAVTGTPSSMRHGEIVTCRIKNAAVRNKSRKVLSITNSNPAVATVPGHGFNDGDVVVHQISAGMTELNYRPVMVRHAATDTYEFGMDTSRFAAFIAGSAKQYITLNVGGRGAYPVVFGDGTTPASQYGDGYIAAGDYKTFSFDKNLVASTDVKGAWIFNDLGWNNAFGGGVPLEICTALINEMMEMAAPGKGPFNIWITIPHRALLSMDPDYEPGSNWATNAVETILHGANGYPGLDSRCNLLVEYSNETWNFAGSGFSQTPYLARLGALRWPSSGPTNTADYSTLRSVVMANDIKKAFPKEPRIKFVLCGQGTLGLQAGNSIRINGGKYFNTDPLNVWRVSPVDHFDFFGWAGYFSAPASFDAANLSTMTAAWLAAEGNAAQQEVICASYVNGIIGSGTGETISRYGKVLLPAYASAMAARGKATVMYEGGWDRSVTNAAKDQNNFLIACKKSKAWANALKGFFDLFKSTEAAGFPADYVELGDRWGHAFPDLYAGRVEGASLDEAWTAIKRYNSGN